MFIDCIFDLVCPWCFIGKRRLEQSFVLRPPLKPEIHWRHFMLNPDMPTDGMDRDAYLIEKFGDEAQVQRLYASLNAVGQTVGINFDFENIQFTPNTMNAHRLVHYANKSDKSEPMVEALFNAYFIQGQDIGDFNTLVDIGQSVGLAKKELSAYLSGTKGIARILDDNAEVHRLGINSVPSYAFNGHMIIAGAQEPEILSRMLDAAMAEA